MKKILVLLLAIISVFTMAVACNSSSNTSTSTSSFSSLGQSVSSQNSTSQGGADQGTYTVTEAEFNSAINFEGLTQYKINITGTEVDYDSEEEMPVVNLNGCHIVDGNKEYFAYDNMEIYYEPAEEENCLYAYTCSDGNGFYRSTINANEKFGAITIINELSFSDFTFNQAKNAYTANIDDSLYTVQFKDSKLVSVRVDSKEAGFDVYTLMEVVASTQTITMPEEFFDTEGGEPVAKEEWEALFELENCLATTYLTTTTYVEDESFTGDYLSSIIYSGETWLYQDEDENVYFDGEKTYCNGKVDQSAYEVGTIWELIEIKEFYSGIAYYQQASMYYAGSIELGDRSYTDVSVSINEDGKVEYVNYTETFSIENSGVEEVIEYEFTLIIDWEISTIENPEQYTQLSDWAKMFDLDKVSITYQTTLNSETTTKTLKVDGAKHIITNNGERAYFDGIYTYYSAEDFYDSVNAFSKYEFLLFFSICANKESYFEEIETGVYYAELIEGVYVIFKDVTITTQDGKIIAVSYIDDFETFEVQCEQTITYDVSILETEVADLVNKFVLDDWYKLFYMQNFTVKETWSLYEEDAYVDFMYYDYKFDDAIWSCNSYHRDTKEEEYSFYYSVNYDGSKYYYNEIEGVEQTSNINWMIHRLIYLSCFKDAYTETTQGNVTTYSVEEIDIFGSSNPLQNVVITVTDNQITSISYETKEILIGDYGMEMIDIRVAFEFTNHGVTEV